MRRVLIALAGAGLAAAAVATGVRANPLYGAPQPALPPAEGVGCYWYRGVHYCSRYCYWEIDGYRYCQRRLSDAVSQAPALLLVEPFPVPVTAAPAPRRKGRPLK